MHPVLLQLGPMKLYTYGLMIALGFLAALYMMQRDAKRAGIDPDLIGNMALWSLVLGVAGTRLLHIVMFPENYSWSDPIGWINLTKGGLVFHGAIPVVLLYTFIALRRHKVAFLPVCDVVFPYVPLAQAFGRIGCFFYGCCFGLRSDLPWAISFPPGSPAYESQASDPSFHLRGHAGSFPVHPTQIYSAIGLLCICMLLLLLRKRWHPYPGVCFPLYFIFYGIMRFVVEAFRGDGNPRVGLFTTQQVFCLGMIVAGTGLLLYLRHRAARGKRSVQP